MDKNLKRKSLPLIILLGVLVLLSLSSCSFLGECARNNTGTLTVTNHTNDAIRVQIDGVNYGYINQGKP